MDSIGTFVGVLGGYLGYGRRGWVLVPTVLVAPLCYLLVVSYLVPATAGGATFHDEYSDFFQTAAAVIASLLVVIAVEFRFNSKGARLANRVAAVFATIWIGIAEIAALAALNPALTRSLDAEVFSATVSGGISGLLAVVLVAALSESH